MTNQRPPSDDLQKGETDPHTTIDELKVQKPAITQTFKVWWTDKEGSDHHQKVDADSVDAARKVIENIENCNYIVSCEKIEKFNKY